MAKQPSAEEPDSFAEEETWEHGEGVAARKHVAKPHHRCCCGTRIENRMNSSFPRR
jgi:hypothetical protein